MLEGQVDDPIRGRRGGRQTVQVVEVAANDGRAGCRDRGGRSVGASQAGDLVSAVEQLGDNRGTDVTGRAGDENAHERTSRSRDHAAGDAGNRCQLLTSLYQVTTDTVITCLDK